LGLSEIEGVIPKCAQPPGESAQHGIDYEAPWRVQDGSSSLRVPWSWRAPHGSVTSVGAGWIVWTDPAVGFISPARPGPDREPGR
jgi:hypothetical protein